MVWTAVGIDVHNVVLLGNRDALSRFPALAAVKPSGADRR